MSQSPDPSLPLATAAQLDAERRLLAVLARPDVLAARAATLQMMREHPIAAAPDAVRLAEEVLDKWLAKMAFDSFQRGAATAQLTWNNQIAPYEWFGHRVPGSAAAVDNPDFLYRAMSIDGGAEYEIRGSVEQPGGSVAFQVTDEPGGRLGFAKQEGSFDMATVAALAANAVETDAAGGFVVTLGPNAADGRNNHIQTPDRRLYVIARNVQDRWTLNPHRLTVVRRDGRTESEARDDEAIGRGVADDLMAYVSFWLEYKDHLAGGPGYNQLIGPVTRTGGWATGAFVRTRLADDEAIVITMGRTASDYVGIQFANIYMVSPDPIRFGCCRNRSQSTANADGSFTYVLCREDPGVRNWIDPAGSSEGWLGLRWWGLPAEPEQLVRDFAVVKLDELGRMAALPRIDPAGREAEMAERRAEWQRRVRGV